MVGTTWYFLLIWYSSSLSKYCTHLKFCSVHVRFVCIKAKWFVDRVDHTFIPCLILATWKQALFPMSTWWPHTELQQYSIEIQLDAVHSWPFMWLNCSGCIIAIPMCTLYTVQTLVLLMWTDYHIQQYLLPLQHPVLIKIHDGMTCIPADSHTHHISNDNQQHRRVQKCNCSSQEGQGCSRNSKQGHPKLGYFSVSNSALKKLGGFCWHAL